MTSGFDYAQPALNYVQGAINYALSGVEGLIVLIHSLTVINAKKNTNNIFKGEPYEQRNKNRKKQNCKSQLFYG